MSRRLHAADRDARARIARATAFSVYQYRHRNPYRQEGFASMAEADAHAQKIEREWTARPAIIYAFCEGVWLTVPPDVRAQAQKGATP